MKRLLFIFLWLNSVLNISAQIPYVINDSNGGSLGVGTDVLTNNTGLWNSAFGYTSMYTNTTGYNNSAFGSFALFTNTSGYGNSAAGHGAMYSNTTGYKNNAIGSYALYSNTTGYENTAMGYYALSSNSTGYANTSIGHETLQYNTTGYANTATGYHSLWVNTTGEYNTAIGALALTANTTGYSNVAIGGGTLLNSVTGYWNTAVGNGALGYCTGSNNTGIGRNAGQLSNNFNVLNNSTAIGFEAVSTASNQVRIGNSSVTSIGGYASWSNLSDGRFKKDIREDVSGLDFINKLRPISYSIDKKALNKFLGLKEDLNTKSDEIRKLPLRQNGFIAQEVEKLIKESGFVFDGIETPQNENDHYSIRYAEFVVPLVKAVQELSAKVDEQQRTIERFLQETNNGKPLLTKETLKEVVLFQNSPNPFKLDTEIKMNIPSEVHSAVLFIYDLNGKQIEKRNITERGNVVVIVEGRKLNSGMYLYTLVTDNKASETKRMILTE